METFVSCKIWIYHSKKFQKFNWYYFSELASFPHNYLEFPVFQDCHFHFFFFFNFPWNLIPVNLCASISKPIVYRFVVFSFLSRWGKKDGKKIRKNSICDWYLSSFFFYPHHFPREFPFCFATLFRTRIHLERPTTKRRRKARWNFSHDPWIAKPRSRFTTFGS